QAGRRRSAQGPARHFALFRRLVGSGGSRCPRHFSRHRGPILVLCTHLALLRASRQRWPSRNRKKIVRGVRRAARVFRIDTWERLPYSWSATMAENRLHLEAIFFAARQKPPEERAAYLDQACGDDPVLRQRAEQFLSAQAEIGSFLESGVVPPVATIDEAITERPGTLIGPYKLMGQIGEGGIGLVFVAEQQHPVRRKVALKVIKPGMDTRQVVARFEAERQALALMDHPNIAKVHDGGETAGGRPYFVMELVKGVPITDFCDAN